MVSVFCFSTESTLPTGLSSPNVNDELEVWFDANANWVMTENELNSIDQLQSIFISSICNMQSSLDNVLFMLEVLHATKSLI